MLEDSLYAIYLKTLVKSSIKLIKLEEILKKMQERLNKAIAKGEPKEKIVYTIAHPVVLGLLYRFFKVFRKDFNIVIISALIDIIKCT